MRRFFFDEQNDYDQSIKGGLYRFFFFSRSQHLSLIDLSDSPNDDVTYLAASFNSLSSTISNLMGIFQKFVLKDVVAKAYREHTIRLEVKNKINFFCFFLLKLVYNHITGFYYD